jgi:hypothetical protein
MCNCLHEDSKPIEEEGEGWKMFTRNYEEGYGKLAIWVENGEFDYRNKNADGWIMWDCNDIEAKYKASNRMGFCFFKSPASLEQAKKVARNYNTINPDFQDIICKIKYRGGLGHHMDRGTFGPDYPVDICLCKEFKIIEEISLNEE